MFDYDKVNVVVKRIVDEVSPKMIVVFGSVARREAKKDSDLDLLVVLDDDDVVDKEIYSQISKLFIGLKLDFDLIVMANRDFEHYRNNKQSFTNQIVTTGEVVYAQ